MSVRSTSDGRNIYCSGLLDQPRIQDIFSRGVIPDGATIYSARFGTYRKGLRCEKGLHIDVKNDSAGNAGIWITGKDEIASVFSELAGIEHFKWAYRLEDIRVEALYSGGDNLFVGFSAPKKDAEPDS